MAWYASGKLAVIDSALSTLTAGEAPMDLLGDVIKVALMDETFSFNATGHDHFDDVSSAEISATSYSSRGNQLDNPTASLDTSTAKFDADDEVFSSIGGGVNDTFSNIVIIREQDAGVTNANTLLLAHTTVASTTTNGGDITLTWSSSGILTLS